jgi:hypothetical protein
MLQIAPYNPAEQDLFLYEPHEVVFDGGSLTVLRPYAWNPSSLLYGYRRSLEGIVATYRNFSTRFPLGGGGVPNPAPNTGAYEVALVNPPTDPVNRPIWWNSFPPTARQISPWHMLMCAHCIGIESTDRVNVSSLRLSDLYAQGGYLDAMLNLRFISGDNYVVEVPKSSYEYPYTFDSAAGFPPAVMGATAVPSVASIYSADMLVTTRDTPFPLNPLVSLDAGSVPPISDEWYYINAGNLTIQRIQIYRTGGNFTNSPSSGGNARRGVQAMYTAEYDDAFLHDSGSLFVHPIVPPTNPKAGDGVAGVVIGHVMFAPPPYGQSQAFINDPPPRKWLGQTILPAMQPAMVDRQDAAYPNFYAYWNGRSKPYPTMVDRPLAANTATATQAQLSALQATVSYMRTSSF